MFKSRGIKSILFFVAYLSTRRLVSADSRRLTDVLMVTTTEWMVYGVHAHTSHSWPAVTLRLVFEVGTTGLQDRLVDTTASSNDALKLKRNPKTKFCLK